MVQWHQLFMYFDDFLCNAGVCCVTSCRFTNISKTKLQDEQYVSGMFSLHVECHTCSRMATSYANYEP